MRVEDAIRYEFRQFFFPDLTVAVSIVYRHTRFHYGCELVLFSFLRVLVAKLPPGDSGLSGDVPRNVAHQNNATVDVTFPRIRTVRLGGREKDSDVTGLHLHVFDQIHGLIALDQVFR